MEPLNVIEDVYPCLGARSVLPTVHSFALEHFEKAFLPRCRRNCQDSAVRTYVMSVTHFRFGVSIAKSRASGSRSHRPLTRALLLPTPTLRNAPQAVRAHQSNYPMPTAAFAAITQILPHSRAAEHAVALGVQGGNVLCQTLVVARSGTQRSLSPVVVTLAETLKQRHISRIGNASR